MASMIHMGGGIGRVIGKLGGSPVLGGSQVHVVLRYHPSYSLFFVGTGRRIMGFTAFISIDTDCDLGCVCTYHVQASHQCLSKQFVFPLVMCACCTF